MRVLFVCTGNTCRSPMAAAWFKKLCDEKGLTHIKVDSAGLAPKAKDAVSEKARAVLTENGLIPLRLRSAILHPRMVHMSDLIMTMTTQHYEALIERFPFAEKKTRPLMAALHRRGSDVFDPYGGSLDDYRRCLNMMKPALEALLERIQ